MIITLKPIKNVNMKWFHFDYINKYMLISFVSFFLNIAKADSIEYINTITGNIENVSNATPTRDIEQCTDGLIVTYRFNHIIKQKDDIFSNCFLLKIDGFYLPDTPQYPAIPFRNEKFVLPMGKEGSIQIIDSMSIDYPINMSSARASLDDTSYAFFNSENTPSMLQFAGYYPNSIVNEGENLIFNGQTIFNCYITPVKYDYNTKIAKIYNYIRFKIVYKTASRSLLQNDTVRFLYKSSNSFLNNITANGTNEVAYSSDNSIIPCDYLIISVPDYMNAVEKFADWKRLSGYNVHVLYNSIWTENTIKACIDSVYDNSPNLTYALLVGDHDVIPAVRKEDLYHLTGTTGSAFYYTDYPYGLINNDHYQEVLIGRLSVASIESSIAVVEKIIDYEKNPPKDSSFYKDGLNTAYFEDKGGLIIDYKSCPDGYEDRRYVQTSEDIASYLINNHDYNIKRVYTTDTNVNPSNWSRYYSFGDPIPDYLTREAGFNWNGTGQDVVNQINNGVFFVIHRDHGTHLTWEKLLLNPVLVSQLNNKGKLPVVFSINCKSGDFTFRECLAEMLQRKADGGSVAIIAATNTSYSGYNDILLLGLINAIWPTPGIIINLPNMNEITSHSLYPEYRIGNILRQGLAILEESNYNFQNNTNIEKINYTKDIYELYGDPSMYFYVHEPLSFEEVDVVRTSDSIFVDLNQNVAYITFLNKKNNTIQLYYGNNAACKVISDSVDICISKYNYRPYIINSTDCDLYIQNENIMGASGAKAKSFIGKNIRIGSNVTDKKKAGPVVFKGGKIDIKGETTIISGGTTIEKNTIFSISNK